MRVLVAHNFYQQPGGEDGVFNDEVKLLRRFGHNVEIFTAHNDDLRGQRALPQLVNAVWNREIAHALGTAARAHRAEVVHFHNTFPLISPASYYAAHRAGAAVVQTLHNYRLICPGALLYRQGAVCEQCVGAALPWRGVRHRCYRNSLTASAGVALVVSAHRIRRTWQRKVDAYIALTEFGRAKFIEGGLPPEQISVKPNFLDPDPGAGAGAGEYALFVGRLTEDKGVHTLLDAWKQLRRLVPLRIVGDGPLRDEVQQATAESTAIEYLGQQPRDVVLKLLRDAKFLVFPSRWYEGQPRTIIESLACATPVIASRLGPIEETVNGCSPELLFEPGNADALVNTVNRLLQCAAPTYRDQAHAAYLRSFTADINHARLVEIYQRAIDHFQN